MKYPETILLRCAEVLDGTFQNLFVEEKTNHTPYREQLTCTGFSVLCTCVHLFWRLCSPNAVNTVMPENPCHCLLCSSTCTWIIAVA